MKTSMSSTSAIVVRLFVGACALLCLTPSPLAAQTVTHFIDFESPFPNGQTIVDGVLLDVQYGQDSVVFEPQNPQEPTVLPVIESGLNAPAPHSGTFVAMGPNYSQEFDATPFKIKFTSPQSSVTIFGGSDCSPATGTLSGFDSTGTLIPGAVAGPISLTPGKTDMPFNISTSTAQIWSISFVTVGPEGPDAIASCDQAIDDMTIIGTPPAGTAPPPTIALTSPGSFSFDTYGNSLVAAGTVSGTSLYKIVVDVNTTNVRPGQAQTSEFLFPYPSGNWPTGTNIPFSFLLDAIGALPFGSYTVVATVTDIAGQQAQASVSFVNGDAATNALATNNNLGSLQFAMIAEQCQMIFYQNGAVAYSPIVPLQQHYLVPTGIATEWEKIATMYPPSPVFAPFTTIGCPLEARTNFGTNNIPAPSTAWGEQVFQRGTIYLPTPGVGTYAPTLIANALNNINSLRVLAAPANHGVGFPVSDPSWDMDTTNPTWFFQRYDTLGLGPTFENTVEIRGRTPTLFVERVGGDLGELSSSQATPSNPHPQPVVSPTTPTIWQQFPCSLPTGGTFPSSCNLSSMPPSPDPLSGLAPAGSSTPYSGTTICGAPVTCDQTYASDTQSSISCASDSACADAQFQGIAGGAQNEWVDRVTGVSGPNSTVVPVYDPTTYEGIIRALDVNGPDVGSHLTNVDYFVDHQECNTTFDQHLADVGAGATAIGDCLNVLEVAVTEIISLFGGGPNSCSSAINNLHTIVAENCRSDWNLHTRPIPDPKNWGFLSTGNYRELSGFESDFEIEFEAQFASAYFNYWTPLPGDLISVHGRQIVDCAHCPFNAEIHPADMIIDSASQVLPPFLQTTPIPERQTVATIWGNGYLLQGQPVTEMAFAPPRISATAQLLVQHHETGYYVQNALVAATEQPIPGQGMQITLSGTAPSITVGPDGEWMYPEDNPATYVDYWLMTWLDN